MKEHRLQSEEPRISSGPDIALSSLHFLICKWDAMPYVSMRGSAVSQTAARRVLHCLGPMDWSSGSDRLPPSLFSHMPPAALLLRPADSPAHRPSNRPLPAHCQGQSTPFPGQQPYPHSRSPHHVGDALSKSQPFSRSPCSESPMASRCPVKGKHLSLALKAPSLSLTTTPLGTPSSSARQASLPSVCPAARPLPDRSHLCGSKSSPHWRPSSNATPTSSIKHSGNWLQRDPLS